MITEKVNLVEEAQGQLLAQFANSENVRNFLSPFISQLQQLESVFFDLFELRWLSVAEGAQLDKIGDLLDLTRGGLDDADYRAQLLNQIDILKSCGTGPEIYSIIKNYTGAETVEIRPTEDDNEFDLYIVDLVSSVERTEKILAQIKSAGVRAVLNCSEVAYAVFDDAAKGFDTAFGFMSATDATEDR